MNQRRTSDTLPRPGRVNQVCKEWLVLEDGALAYQLQQEEVNQHLTGNKQRNATVREDIPHAKLLQQEAEEEAARLAAVSEERDRKIAEQLAAQISKRNAARQLSKPEGDMNVVGLPLPPTVGLPLPPIVGLPLPPTVGLPPSPHVPQPPPPQPNYYEICVEKEEEEDWPPPPPPEGELSKEEQERKDMELAARLQEEEELSEELDRKLAIEAQDEELARLLQEKERQRARRARERAKARRLQAASPSPSPSLPPPNLPPPNLPAVAPPHLLPTIPPPRLSSPFRGNEIPNIAMAIDPTYQRYNTTGAVRRFEEPNRSQRDESRHMRSLPSPRKDAK